MGTESLYVADGPDSFRRAVARDNSGMFSSLESRFRNNNPVAWHASLKQVGQCRDTFGQLRTVCPLNVEASRKSEPLTVRKLAIEVANL